MREGYNKLEPYKAEVIADSISPDGVRLTSLEATFPRMILAEFNTHRMFSRNSASSRAIPVERQIARAIDQPYIPLRWGKLQPGMQSSGELSPANEEIAQEVWLGMRDQAVLGAIALNGGISEIKNEATKAQLFDLYGEETLETLPAMDERLHKQFANRPLEPFMWHTVLVTATEWGNFYGQRLGKSAQPEIQHTAKLMRQVFDSSEPVEVDYDQYHTPYIDQEVLDQKPSPEDILKISSARSARLSYLTQSNPRPIEQDINMHDNSLTKNGHMSPLEHVAKPFSAYEMRLSKGVKKVLEQIMEAPDIAEGLGFRGNFYGWHQWRKQQPYESDFSEAIKALNLDE